MKSWRQLTIILPVLFCTTFAHSQLQTVQLNASADTYIVATQSGASYTGDGNNYGTNTSGPVAKTTNGPPITVRTVYRTLVRFDLDSIPEGAVITSARIKLKKSYPSPYTSVNFYAIKITKDWEENSVTWGDIYSSTYSADRVGTATSTDTSEVQFDVLNHVIDFKCKVKNFGWMVTITSEANDTPAQKGQSFYLRESNYDPILRIEYYPPIEVSCNVTGASAMSNSDGALDISVSGGYGSSYTYSWSNSSGTLISTSQDVSSLAAGYYRCSISDGYAGLFRAYFIVPCQSEDLEITIQPDSLYSEDALIVGSSETTNYQNYGRFMAGYGTAPGPSWSEVNALVKFLICLDGLDDQYSLTEAELILTGFNHSTTGGSNAATVRRIETTWCEKCLTWQKRPAVVSQNSVGILSITGSLNDTIDVSGLLDWSVMNPDLNFGFEIRVDTSLVSPYSCYRSYYGSEYLSSSNLSKRPKVKLKISPTPVIGIVTRQLDASYYTFKDKIVRFQFIEEYSDTDGQLDFIIYPVEDSGDSPVLTSAMISPISSSLGDHIRVIDAASLSSGFYILEIRNEKEEKHYLRFNI